jgi:hypothetical protein
MLLSLFFSLVLSNAEAKGPAKTIKVADGTQAQCQNATDAFTHRRGAHTMQVEAPVIKGDWIFFQVNVEFLACKEQQDSWNFVKVAPYASLGLQIDNDEITINTRNIFITLSTKGERITSALLTAESQTIAVGLSDVLSLQEMESLNKGESVGAEIQLHLEKDLQYASKSGLNSEERATYGAFGRQFMLKR